jgi:hypothetical protein
MHELWRLLFDREVKNSVLFLFIIVKSASFLDSHHNLAKFFVALSRQRTL